MLITWFMVLGEKVQVKEGRASAEKLSRGRGKGTLGIPIAMGNPRHMKHHKRKKKISTSASNRSSMLCLELLRNFWLPVTDADRISHRILNTEDFM